VTIEFLDGRTVDGDGPECFLDSLDELPDRESPAEMDLQNAIDEFPSLEEA
jgi:hypothetical protein